MLEELLVKQQELKERLSILNTEWNELEEDLRFTKIEYEEVYNELEQIEQEIKEEM